MRVGVIAGRSPPSSWRFPPATAGQEHRPPPAGHAGRYGRTVRNRARRAAGHPRPAGRGEAAAGQSAEVPNALSFLTYQRWKAEVQASNAFPQDPGRTTSRCCITAITSWWAGTIFIGVMVLAALPCGAAGSTSRAPLLWLLMLMLPFPYIATTAGWITAELGRQPWLIYGLMRTPDGILAARLRRQRAVHPDRLHGHVHGAGHPVPVPGLPRDRTGPDRRGTHRRSEAVYGNHLVLPGRR